MPRVLISLQNGDVASLIGRRLRTGFHEVHSIRDSRLALMTLARLHPAVFCAETIRLDIDGMALADHVRRLSPKTTLVLVAGFRARLLPGVEDAGLPETLHVRQVPEAISLHLSRTAGLPMPPLDSPRP